MGIFGVIRLWSEVECSDFYGLAFWVETGAKVFPFFRLTNKAIVATITAAIIPATTVMRV
jgi:hypothetical protein